jgi:putative tricarboxylic transport membrane protein
MSDFLSNVSLGLSVALSLQNIAFCFIGCAVGTLVGVLPGLGPVATVAMLLPMTFYLEPVTGLIMLAGIFYGAQYGGGITAILLKLPGEASAITTTFDGYQMARQGRAGAALAISALASFFAGTVATLLIVVASPPLARVALAFGAAEYFALMTFGLVAVVMLARGSVLKAVCMVLVGLLLATVGTDQDTGALRFTFGIPILMDGVGFIPVAMGLFGIADILVSLAEKRGQGPIAPAKVTGLWPSRQDFRQVWKPALRGTAIGSLFGVLPGGGPTISTFASYTIEKKISRNPEKFGQGAVEGVAGPESANNAAAQTAFIPMLTLGIPSNAVLAIMMASMTIHGVTPGPAVMSKSPGLFWGMIVSMWIGNLMLLILNLPLIGIWVKLLSTPYRLLYPAILLFCAVGVYSVSNSVYDVGLMMLFGVIGYALIRLEADPTPLLLGLVLGPLMEQNLRRTMVIADGDWTVFFTKPISAALLSAAAVLVMLIIAPNLRRARPG